MSLWQISVANDSIVVNAGGSVVECGHCPCAPGCPCPGGPATVSVAISGQVEADPGARTFTGAWVLTYYPPGGGGAPVTGLECVYEGNVSITWSDAQEFSGVALLEWTEITPGVCGWRLQAFSGLNGMHGFGEKAGTSPLGVYLGNDPDRPWTATVSP